MPPVQDALRTARLAAPLLALALLLTGCGSGPVTNVHSADGAEITAHSEEGASAQAGEPGTGEAEGEHEGEHEGEDHSEDGTTGDAIASGGGGDDVSGGIDAEFLQSLRAQHVEMLLLAEQQVASGQDPALTELAQRIVAQQNAEIAEIDKLLGQG